MCLMSRLEVFFFPPSPTLHAHHCRKVQSIGRGLGSGFVLFSSISLHIKGFFFNSTKNYNLADDPFIPNLFSHNSLLSPGSINDPLLALSGGDGLEMWSKAFILFY